MRLSLERERSRDRAMLARHIRCGVEGAAGSWELARKRRERANEGKSATPQASGEKVPRAPAGRALQRREGWEW